MYVVHRFALCKKNTASTRSGSSRVQEERISKRGRLRGVPSLRQLPNSSRGGGCGAFVWCVVCGGVCVVGDGDGAQVEVNAGDFRRLRAGRVIGLGLVGCPVQSSSAKFR